MNRRTAIVMSVIAVCFACLLLTGTRGGLEYFSPYTLKLTTQSEFALLGGFPIYRSSLAPVDNELVTFIQDEGFVVPQQPMDQRRVLIFHWNWAWKDGYGPMYDILHRNRESVMAWCKEDRQRAQLYWSEGFRYLRSENPADVQIGEAILNYGWRAQSIEKLETVIASIKKDFAR